MGFIYRFDTSRECSIESCFQLTERMERPEKRNKFHVAVPNHTMRIIKGCVLRWLLRRLLAAKATAYGLRSRPKEAETNAVRGFKDEGLPVGSHHCESYG